jgi:hypothetical protein
VRILQIIGALMSVTGFLFVVANIAAAGPADLTDLPIDRLAAILCLSIVFYTALLISVSKGFVHLLEMGGVRFVTFEQALVVWGKANIAKYLPSNLLHFAGRQVLGAAYRWPQTSVALATVLEIAIQVVVPASLVILLLAAARRLDVVADVLWLMPLIIAAGIALGLALLHKHLWRHVDRFLPSILKVQLGNRPFRAILLATIWYALFFVGMCLVVTALYSLSESSNGYRDLLILNAIFLISWIIGFVVPGAPGGIGVREGSFAVLGGIFFPVESLVLVAFLMRFVTLAGEALFFFLAAWLARVEPITASAKSSQPNMSPHERRLN